MCEPCHFGRGMTHDMVHSASPAIPTACPRSTCAENERAGTVAGPCRTNGDINSNAVKMMPLMYFNTLAAWYLLALTCPWLLMELWMKGSESERDQSGQNQRAS
jgi:hypothetical protein